MPRSCFIVHVTCDTLLALIVLLTVMLAWTVLQLWHALDRETVDALLPATFRRLFIIEADGDGVSTTSRRSFDIAVDHHDLVNNVDGTSFTTLTSSAAPWLYFLIDLVHPQITVFLQHVVETISSYNSAILPSSAILLVGIDGHLYICKRWQLVVVAITVN